MTYGTGGAFGSAPSAGGGYANIGGGYMPGGGQWPGGNWPGAYVNADGCRKMGCGGGCGCASGCCGALAESVDMVGMGCARARRVFLFGRFCSHGGGYRGSR